jgi:hypothetical protein
MYSENYQGRELQEMLFEDSGLLQYTDENINKIWKKYFSQLVFMALLVILCAILQIRLPLALYFLLIIILAGSINIFGFFQIMKWEQYYAGEGINLSARERTKRMFAMMFISLFCITAACLLASDSSLLPFSAVIGFFTWFFSLFSRDVYVHETVRNTETYSGPEGMPFDFSAFEEVTPLPLAEFMAKYGWPFFKFALIAVAATAFIRFMISPLFDRVKSGDKLTFRQKLVLIIKEWFKGLLNAFKSIYSFLRSNRKTKLIKTEEINRAAANLFEAYSPAKKRNMKQSVTLFARLIIWGSRERDVTWRASHAPGEYCGFLAAAVPDDAKNEGIIRCGGIFEKALYSADGLLEQEQEEFKRLIEEITTEY